jgi:hypothetical protein
VSPHVEDGEDVGVVEGGDGAGLALEPRESLRVGAHFLRKDLDRHLAPEAWIERAVDLAHPPGPEKPEDLVRPQPGSG